MRLPSSRITNDLQVRSYWEKRKAWLHLGDKWLQGSSLIQQILGGSLREKMHRYGGLSRPRLGVELVYGTAWKCLRAMGCMEFDE